MPYKILISLLFIALLIIPNNITAQCKLFKFDDYKIYLCNPAAVSISATNAPSLNALAKVYLNHKNQNFGKNPKIIKRDFQGRNAIVIISKEIGNKNSPNSVILVQYKNPVTLQLPSGPKTYGFLAISTDKDSVSTIISFLQFFD